MSIKLTKKQKLVYDFIANFTEVQGLSPSYRDIRDGLGLASVSAVAEHIDNLAALGALKKNPGEARSIELIDINHSETVNLFKNKIASATETEIDILKEAAIILGIDLEG